MTYMAPKVRGDAAASGGTPEPSACIARLRALPRPSSSFDAFHAADEIRPFKHDLEDLVRRAPAMPRMTILLLNAAGRG